MPVIVVGADTERGIQLLDALGAHQREVRAFISDASHTGPLRRLGVKVAVGDVSDDSHVGAAAIGAHTAVLMVEAASDERERSFAASGAETLAKWWDAMAEASVKRILWVGDPPERPSSPAIPSAIVDPHLPDWIDEIRRLDDALAI